MNSLIDDLQWRYSVKKYNPAKKISQADFDILKQVLSLVPTSNGLQPYKFLIIEDPEIRKQLREKSFNQSQITDASHLIVMCAYNTLSENDIDGFMNLNASVREVSLESLRPYREHLHRSLLKRTDYEHLRSNEKQCYIALGQLIQAAALLRIDSTPMEGFLPAGYNEVLNLSEQNLNATVVCALGYRAEEDPFQHMRKVRKQHLLIFEII